MVHLKNAWRILVVLTLMVTAVRAAAADNAVVVNNGSGFPGSATIVGVDLAPTTSAVGVNFKIRFESGKLRFVAAQPGASATTADKEVEAETPEDGAVSVVVYGLNNNVIPAGRIVNLQFNILATAGVGQQLALTGVDAASTNPQAQPISTTISNATITVTACTSPGMPTNVRASDGTYGDRVRITWDAANGASTYRVYRGTSNSFSSATLLTEVSGTSYNDYGASAALFASTGGCGATYALTIVSYNYWVVAKNACGASSPAGPDSGYRAGAKAASRAPAYVPALPAQSKAAGIAPDATLAIRLRADEPITEVWGEVTAEGFGDSNVEWVPVDGTQGRDGWVVYRPSGPWLPGELVTMMAGGTIRSGAPLGPLTQVFRVRTSDETVAKGAPLPQPETGPGSSDARGSSASSADIAGVAEYVGEPLSTLPGAVGETYQITPDGPYVTPQRVWLPVPDGITPDGLTAFFCQQDETGAIWHYGSDVAGWLAGDALILNQGGRTYYGVLVNHGGIVSLGAADINPVALRASMAATPDTAPFESVILLAGTVAILAIFSRVSRRHRAETQRVVSRHKRS